MQVKTGPLIVIGLSLRAGGSGKGRRAVSVLRDLNPGVTGFRYAGHVADKTVVREERR